MSTEISYSNLPYISVKKTKQGKMEYPLISMAALKKIIIFKWHLVGYAHFHSGLWKWKSI
ncbi:hypothetical protein JQ038_12470 [Clostridium botulinum]|nr:hypothetical protein [Clostridium botulinum]MCS4482967.1 hypothetical protein [Clostridium botulinum]MCS4524332.1 hypothetical protein [Clostridium botulinum]